MRRAAGVCTVSGCTRTPTRGGRCQQHAPPPWGGSAETRQHQLPPRRVYDAMRRAVRRRAAGRCERCRAHVRKGEGQVDHRVPLAAGGATTPANLWLLCDRCAAAKTALDLATLRRKKS